MKMQVPAVAFSPLGERVADLLGELFLGIYHLDHNALRRVDWSSNQHIEFSLGWRQLATADYDELTRLVFLAHHMAIRVSIEASTHHYLRLIFHQRVREGEHAYRHLALDDAVRAFKESVSVPEYQELAPIPV